MKKAFVAVLVTTSALLFAKTESPKTENPQNATETVLVAKKTIENTDQLQKPITLSTTARKKELTTAEKCAIELAVGPIIAGPPVHCFQLGAEGIS
ncbi:hypothetical protein WH221_13470 [Chryseobacterium culicis]|uniref:Uncharacterized protein n=1 Tax=Chryseobacterium culicis TaxID=680127 RepID=A0A2S9CRJ3_CHRCI|nr:hypothetical protein [Chryseobacterium culicis]PRB83128.1 hypothetical protein CQ022_13455 [Chryseobacterium culicis]PRB89370.1 hypothetical protein CQ033_12355 [Chryseobacterium culicis]